MLYLNSSKLIQITEMNHCVHLLRNLTKFA
jgi:hypothetical protein